MSRTPSRSRPSNAATFGESLSPEAYARLEHWLIGNIPHSVALGLSIVEMQRGRAVISLPWAPHLVGNPDTGVLAGGAITALLDSVSGSAVASLMLEIVPFATLDLRIDYNRPAEPERTVIAEAECYRLSPNIAFTRALAHHGDRSAPVAAATGTFMMTTTPARQARGIPRAEAAPAGAKPARNRGKEAPT